MQYGMYVSAAGALANSYRQDVITNNLANVDTVGFKRDLALVKARQTETAKTGQQKNTAAVLEGIGGGLFALPTYTDFSPASLKQTDSKLDLALNGKGFFAVQKGTQTNYTRDGRFTLNDQNQLVTFATKLPVLDAAGQPIELDRSLLDQTQINESGVISQGQGSIARLGVVDFQDTTQLRKQGDNLYVSAGAAPSQASSTPVRQGFLEESGVNAIDQLTDMIRAQRLFQTNISMLQMQDETLNQAVTQLGRIAY
jgi:flagellar basal-body rod protein FlgF